MPSAASTTPTSEQPHGPVVTHEQRAHAAARSELDRRGVHEELEMVGSGDIDEDGDDDTVYSAGTGIGCVVAVQDGDSHDVVVLESSVGAAPAQTTCLPLVMLRDRIMLAQYVRSGVESGNSVVELYSIDDGAARLAYVRVDPVDNVFEVQDYGIGVEIVATRPDAAAPARRRLVQFDPTGAVIVESCWAPETPVLDDLMTGCEVTIPRGASQRLLESDRAGIPAAAEAHRVLYAGAPATSATGPRTWCVDTGVSGPRWIELPRRLTARCAAPAQTNP